MAFLGLAVKATRTNVGRFKGGGPKWDAVIMFTKESGNGQLKERHEVG
jgi:hypothetical protein